MNELFEQILYDALKEKVSDIHLLSKENGIIKFRKKGRLYDYQTIEKKEMSKLLNYIRFISKIDLNYFRKPQTGHYIFQYNSKKLNLRISSLMGKEMDSIVIRILNNHQKITLNNLTYDEQVRRFLKQIAKQKNGLFVISGATGSGKSTTLYALLDEINKHYQKNIITLEDPIEIEKDYCLQIELNEKQGVNYNESLKQILRHDPDVIMIGEIRDEQTAKLALTCALTGHLVLTTIHASHCINTLKRLTNLNIQLLDLEDVLIGVMTQKMNINRKQKIVVESEFMDRESLKKYFKNNKVDYYDFMKAHHYLVEKGVLDE